MTETLVTEVAPGRRHIIKRPRLTRLLDESAARIILLVAPAGYGKTTLAREWLSQNNRRHEDYVAASSSGDPTAFALELLSAGKRIADHVGTSSATRLRAGVQEPEPQEIARLLAQDLAAWPSDAWLFIDDYHLLMDSPATEHLLRLLTSHLDLQLLITSRRRPSWLSARDLLYGDVLELGKHVLAMSSEEAYGVLGTFTNAEASGLLALAAGWPAVIGLAALSGEAMTLKSTLPETLYDFFAEELYRKLPDDMHEPLCRLSLSPLITRDLAEEFLGASTASDVLARATSVGFFTPSHDANQFDLHPLLRHFLLARASSDLPGDIPEAVDTIGCLLLKKKCWDSVYELVVTHGTESLLISLLQHSLASMLEEGRVATVARWLGTAKQLAIDDPHLDVADAEVRLRHGDLGTAEALALRGADNLDSSSRWLSRSYAAAGRAAHLEDREEAALCHYTRARSVASNEVDLQHALWGQFIAANQLELGTADESLSTLSHLVGNSSDSTLRLINARAMLARRSGASLTGSLREARAAKRLVQHSRDPMIRSSFLNCLTHLLLMAAFYAEAESVIKQQTLEAEEYGLDFLLPHLLLAQAKLELGVGNLGSSDALLQEAERERAVLDPHSAAEISTLRLRLRTARHDVHSPALLRDQHVPDHASKSACGELLATQALALACAGRVEEAQERNDQALRRTTSVDTRVISRFTGAIVSFERASDDARECLVDAFNETVGAGVVDAFILAYRAYPRLLGAAVTELPVNMLLDITARAHDEAVLKRALSPKDEPTTKHKLSPREREVQHLLAKGFTNKEIASALFISEATVKVHVRHIFEKLGTRSRVVAALSSVER